MKLDVSSRGRVPAPGAIAEPAEDDPLPARYWDELGETFDLLPEVTDADFEIEPFV